MKQREFTNYKGVIYIKNKTMDKWRACIKINGKRISLGRYLTEKEAAIAYNKKAIELFGEFACLNSIDM
jgi:AP2-like factor, euAP2 lineage